MNPRVQSVRYLPHFKLDLTFENGERKIFSFQAYLKYPVYQALQNEDFASHPKILFGTVVWNDEVDFDPDTLYIESQKLD